MGFRFAALLIVFVSSSLPAVEELVVGIKEAPPFTIKDGKGWRGISVELWDKISKELGVPYKLKETDLKGMLKGLEDGSIDVGVASLTITEEREKKFDFTHPFHTSGLGIAVRSQDNSFVSVIKGMMTPKFLKAVTTLFGVLLVMGFLVWVFENKKNPQFRQDPTGGLADGCWWSAVTMTTVGYGDKVPVTAGGKLIGLFWMFASVIILGSFTGMMASSMTTAKLTSIDGPEDLGRAKIATVEGSAPQKYLIDKDLSFVSVPDLATAMAALNNGEVEAVVYDKPMLHYYAQQFPRTEVLPHVLVRQDFGIGLAENSPYRERINRLILKIISSSEWKETLSEYLK